MRKKNPQVFRKQNIFADSFCGQIFKKYFEIEKFFQFLLEAFKKVKKSKPFVWATQNLHANDQFQQASYPFLPKIPKRQLLPSF